MATERVLDWDEVYDLWATEGRQNDHETARLTGIPRQTISYHAQREGWRQRYLEQYDGVSAQDLAIARVELRHLAKEGMQVRLREIILGREQARDAFGTPMVDADGAPVMTWCASHKDAVAAMKIVTQYAMPADPDPGEIVPAAFRVLPGRELSPEDEAIARLEANAASANTRIKRR